MQNGDLLNDIAAHVESLFKTHFLPSLIYHNLIHTRLVVQHAAEITSYYPLDGEMQFIIQTAAWFHDTGHLVGPMNIHEENSVRLMREFMEKQKLGENLLDKISACIMGTKMPANPRFLSEAILCDADTYHLGTPDFLEIDTLVWKEMEIRTSKTIENKTRKTLAFLMSHNFYTSYCKKYLDKGKQKNIDIIRSLSSVKKKEER